MTFKSSYKLPSLNSRLLLCFVVSKLRLNDFTLNLQVKVSPAMRPILGRQGSLWERAWRRPSSGSPGKDTTKPLFIWELLQEWDCSSTAHVYTSPQSNITYASIKIKPFLCWHWGTVFQAFSVIVFALAAEVLLSVVLSSRLLCDLSSLELYCQSREYVTVKTIIYNTVYLLFMVFCIDLNYGCMSL